MDYKVVVRFLEEVPTSRLKLNGLEPRTRIMMTGKIMRVVKTIGRMIREIDGTTRMITRITGTQFMLRPTATTKMIINFTIARPIGERHH